MTPPSASVYALGWKQIFEPPPSTSLCIRTLLMWPHCQQPNIRFPPGAFGAIVGRCMLLTDVQLREFSIEKHWTHYNASMHSPDAWASWVYENETPSLDEPPTCPEIISSLLGQLFALIPPGNVEFDQELRNQIADSTGKIIMETKDLFQTAHRYIARWRATRNPTTLTKGGLEMFEGLVCPQLLDYATNVATHGVCPMGDKGPVRFKQNPYSPIGDNAEDTSLSIWGDLLLGLLMVFTDAGGKWFGNLTESKLSAVTQTVVTDPDVMKNTLYSRPQT